MTDPSNCAVEEGQEPIFTSFPALEVGKGLTVTTTLSEAVQPNASVTVNVYVVVDAGFAVGLLIPGLFNPVDGLQR